MKVNKNLKKLLENCKGTPKITIMMPTHRKSPDNQKDKIIFKNLSKEVRNSLEKYSNRNVLNSVTENLEKLQEDTMFWVHTEEGLLVLLCEDKMYTFNIHHSVPAQTSISDAFHLNPLLSHEESLGHHYLVDLAKDRMKIYHIGQSGLEEMRDHEIFTSFDELFDDFDADANLNTGSYGGLQGMYHGHREKSEQVEKDRKKFFQYLDKELQNLHIKDNSHFFFSGTKDNIVKFKSMTDKVYYHDLSIEKPLASLKNNELENKIEKIIQSLVNESINKLEKEIERAYHHNKALIGFNEIKKSLDEKPISKIILNSSLRDIKALDKLINQAILKDIEVIVLKDSELKLKDRILAIVY